MSISAGKWTIGKYGAVVTNIPTDRDGYSWEEKEWEYEHSGGYIIAEYIMNCDIKLIAAAPQLLDILECIVDANQEVPQIPFFIYWRAKTLIKSIFSDAKVLGKNPFDMVYGVWEAPPKFLEMGNRYLHHSAYAKH